MLIKADLHIRYVWGQLRVAAALWELSVLKIVLYLMFLRMNLLIVLLLLSEFFKRSLTGLINQISLIRYNLS